MNQAMEDHILHMPTIIFISPLPMEVKQRIRPDTTTVSLIRSMPTAATSSPPVTAITAAVIIAGPSMVTRLPVSM